jgi:hypothetical protein
MFWAGVVRIIHIAVILAVLLGPFYATGVNLTLYAIMIPFIVLHWYTNSNVCALTTLERYLRRGKVQSSNDVAGTAPQGADDGAPEVTECFTCDLIEPVYDLHKGMPGFSSNGIYVITLILWLIAAFKIRNSYQSGGVMALLEP